MENIFIMQVACFIVGSITYITVTLPTQDTTADAKCERVDLMCVMTMLSQSNDTKSTNRLLLAINTPYAPCFNRKHQHTFYFISNS